MYMYDVCCLDARKNECVALGRCIPVLKWRLPRRWCGARAWRATLGVSMGDSGFARAWAAVVPCREPS